MANVVLFVLSMTIGLFFILMGLIKLTPAFNDDVYREMVRNGRVGPLPPGGAGHGFTGPAAGLAHYYSHDDCHGSAWLLLYLCM